MRRGLTLIELLASIALLSVVMTASASWLAIVSETERVASTTLDWESAAEAVLQSIHDEIQVGDFTNTPRPRPRNSRPQNSRIRNPNPRNKSTSDRIQVRDDELVINTREDGQGSIEHTYRFDLNRKQLFLQRNDQKNRKNVIPFLLEIESFECVLDEESSTLKVTLSNGQTPMSRRYRIP